MKRDDLIGRVLGPGTPELTCEQCFEELDRYVELALAGAEPDQRVPGMAAHLEGCPACAEDFHSLRDLVGQERPWVRCQAMERPISQLVRSASPQASSSSRSQTISTPSTQP
jgi:anti-sigma factor RsiW